MGYTGSLSQKVRFQSITHYASLDQKLMLFVVDPFSSSSKGNECFSTPSRLSLPPKLLGEISNEPPSRERKYQLQISLANNYGFNHSDDDVDRND